MNNSGSRTSRKKLVLAIVLYALLILAILMVANVGKINYWIRGVLLLFRPILWGLALAYLLNPFFRVYERKLFHRLRPKGLRRALSLILTYLTLLLIIAVLFALIIPQLYASISGFIADYDNYINSVVELFNRVLEQVDGFLDRMGTQQELLKPLRAEDLKLSAIIRNFDKIMKWAQGLFVSDSGSGSVLDMLGNLVSGAADALFAFFISLYLLSTKEQRSAQIMKIRRALFSDRINSAITRFCTVADRSFGGFIEGKLLDSLIIGILTYIVVAICGMPYPMLLAAIIGITNIIPFVGPIVGAIPTALIILLTDPGKVIAFLIIVVVIQQIDGNIIGPAILGNNTGVSSLCVLISITVMGALWGFTGMLLGVPLFAMIIELTSERIEERLRARGLPSTTENYYPDSSPIDSAQDVRGNTDTIIKQFERKILRLRKKQERGETLSRADRHHMAVHRFLLKIHLIRELSDETLTQFTADEAAHAAEEEAQRLIKEARGIDLLEK